MTRRKLFSGLLSAPVVALFGAATTRADPDEARSLVLGPGKYTIAPGGRIHIPDGSGVRIEGCTFENCVIE